MKIAVTAQGGDMKSPVDPRFGRARHFIVIDTETKEWTAFDNTQNLNAMQGAGIQASRNVADLGVKAVVTGNIGPKAFATLQSAGIDVFIGADGTVEQAFEKFETGALERAGGANVRGHWI